MLLSVAANPNPWLDPRLALWARLFVERRDDELMAADGFYAGLQNSQKKSGLGL